MTTDLQLSPFSYEATVGHLFSAWNTEHAAFLFAHASPADRKLLLSVEDQYLVPRASFTSRSPFHFELNHEVQAHVIKEAHDRRCCLVEVHSHPFPALACFSPTDVTGLLEWVVHVRWRLQDRPYAALVVSPGSFDALVFSDKSSARPTVLNTLMVGATRLHPTGTTAQNWEVLADGRKTF